jgi:hypothetical protein
MIDAINELCPYIDDCVSFAQDVCSGAANDNKCADCEKYRDWIDNNIKNEITHAELKELFLTKEIKGEKGD